MSGYLATYFCIAWLAGMESRIDWTLLEKMALHQILLENGSNGSWLYMHSCLFSSLFITLFLKFKGIACCIYMRMVFEEEIPGSFSRYVDFFLSMSLEF